MKAKFCAGVPIEPGIPRLFCPFESRILVIEREMGDGALQEQRIIVALDTSISATSSILDTRCTELRVRWLSCCTYLLHGNGFATWKVSASIVLDEFGLVASVAVT